MPVHEVIKQGRHGRDELISTYCQALRHLAASGIDTVCYNFMPVLDWTRTDLSWVLPGGAIALRFDQTAFAAFDLYLLERPGAQAEYDQDEQAEARCYLDSLDATSRDKLVNTLVTGLPGAEEHYTLEQFRAVLAEYADIDAERLREHLGYFLRAVIPVAEEVGIRMAIHPDDPPRTMLGLPRVVSTEEDAQRLLDAVPSVANGLTLCTGSYGVSTDVDLAAMARRFGPKIHFAHLRSTKREAANSRSFHEAPHLDGDVDMVAVIQVLVEEERRRELEGVCACRCVPTMATLSSTTSTATLLRVIRSMVGYVAWLSWRFAGSPDSMALTTMKRPSRVFGGAVVMALSIRA